MADVTHTSSSANVQVLQTEIDHLYTISSKLAQAHDSASVLEAVSNYARETGAMGATFYTVRHNERNEAEWLEVSAAWDNEKPHFPLGTLLHLPDLPYTNLLPRHPNQIILFDDLLSSDSLDPASREVFKSLNTHGSVQIPLAVNDQWIGLLAFRWNVPHQFTDIDRRIYTAISNQAAFVTYSTWLARQLEERIVTSQRRAHEMETVAEVSAAAATILELDELLQTVVDLTKTRFALYHAQIYLMDTAGEYLVLASGVGETGRAMRSKNFKIAMNIEHSLVVRAARTRDGVIVNDVTQSPDFLPNPLLPDTRSEMAVPIMIGNKVLGILDVQSESPDRFTAEDVRVKATLTDQIAVAIQNARAFAQAQHTQQLLRTVIDTIPDWIWMKDRDYRYILMNQATARQGFNTTPEEMLGKSDYDLGLPTYLIDGDPERGIHGWRADDRAVLEQQQTLHNPFDVVTFNDGSEHILDTVKLPLRDAANNILGVLGYARDITLARKAEEEVRKRAAELETVAKVGAAATTILNVDELLQTVVDLTQQNFHLYHAQVYLLDQEQKNLVLTAGSREAGRLMRSAGHRISVDNMISLVARTARTRQGVIVNDVTSAPDFLPNPRLPQTRSEMAIPMVVADKLLGVLDVQSEQLNRFTPEDVRIQTTLADQIAVAVQNVQAFVQAQQTQQLLRTVIDTIPDWIWIKDRDYRFSLMNRNNARQAFDSTPEEMLGKSDYDLGVPTYLIEGDPERGLKGWRADDRAVVEGGQTLHVPNDLITFTDGTEHILDTLKLPLRNVGGEIIGSLGYARDITLTRKAEEELRKRATEMETVAKVSTAATTILNVDELLQTVVDLTKTRFDLYHAHIYLLDETGKYLKLAAGAGEIGRMMKERGHRIPVDNELSIVARAARTRRGVSINNVQEQAYFLPNPLLPETTAEMAVPLKVGDNLIGVLDVQAITVGRFTELDLQIETTLADQIAIAVQNARLFAHSLEQAERLREIDRLKSEFLASMSHELRTPLNSIIGYAEVMIDGIDGELPTDAIEDVEAIHDSGQHLLTLINDILDLAKIEAGRMELDLGAVDLHEAIEEVQRLSRVLVKDKPVKLVFDMADNLPALQADHVRLRQILNNLISNAVKFTEHGSVEVKARLIDNGKMVQIGVADTGIGIAPEHLSLIFEQFRQVDSGSTRRSGGTGLGLPITRHLVQMHGGTIHVDSKLGVGSTFTFTLPTTNLN